MTNDPLREAILTKIDELEKEGYQLSFRGYGWTYQYNENHPQQMMTVYKAYAPGDTEHCVRQVFVIEASEPSKYMLDQSIHVTVDGPYEDSGNHFWNNTREDDEKRVFLVTEDWHHYVVEPDSRSSGPGDGFDGRLFTIEYTGNPEFLRQKRIKFEENDDKIIIFSRNVGSQGTIPPKHRHLWSINAKILPFSLGELNYEK